MPKPWKYKGPGSNAHPREKLKVSVFWNGQFSGHLIFDKKFFVSLPQLTRTLFFLKKNVFFCKLFFEKKNFQNFKKFSAHKQFVKFYF